MRFRNFLHWKPLCNYEINFMDLNEVTADIRTSVSWRRVGLTWRGRRMKTSLNYFLVGQGESVINISMLPPAKVMHGGKNDP